MEAPLLSSWRRVLVLAPRIVSHEAFAAALMHLDPHPLARRAGDELGASGVHVEGASQLRFRSDDARGVPVDTSSAEPARVLKRSEALMELGPVLERLEVRLRVRVLVRHVRPAVRLDHADI